ncbi:MAG: T9SS type A sorting domain-containing protein [Saprospiraceae bacterium]
MNKKIQVIILIFLSISFFGKTQNLQVETIVDLNASGGVTFGPDGNIYVSDFGPALGTTSVNTKVYKVEYGTWEVSEFAAGFSGASGARFDSQGNFYQANPSGGRVSKVTLDGNVNLNWAIMSGGPIGVTSDSDDNLYVCIHGNNSIQKITPSGTVTTFASSNLLNCPNGITTAPDGNFYVCNFNDGSILKIDSNGSVSLLATMPFFAAGNGHITYSNGFLFVATIGTGQIWKLSLAGDSELIAGVSQGFSNDDGASLQATFSKPNGIAASITGDTLWVNCSVPTWISNNLALHPGRLRMITGVCSLPDVDCDINTKTKEVIDPFENEFIKLFSPTPNPAKSEVKLSYQIHSTSQKITLKILDASQKVILNLNEGRKNQGKYSIQIDTKEWSSGIYFSILKTEDAILTQRIVIVK